MITLTGVDGAPDSGPGEREGLAAAPSPGEGGGGVGGGGRGGAGKVEGGRAVGRCGGAIEQGPPMHSALKREGVPLYKLARAGRSVERQARPVQIHELELLGFDSPVLELRVRCSKGTYIRTLAEDIGIALGTGAHLAALRRTGSGRFKVKDATALEALRAMPNPRLALLPLAALLDGLP